MRSGNFPGSTPGPHRTEAAGPTGFGPEAFGPEGFGPGRRHEDDGDDDGGERRRRGPERRGGGHGGGRGGGWGRERRGGRRGFGRPGGWQQSDLPEADDVESWFNGRLPEDWFSEVEVTVDREEIIVIGTLAGTDELTGAEADGRISRFRADTRETRMEIADEAQQRYQRKVSWAARAGDAEELFTHISVPVMTRLKQPERRVLDTLVDAGVARSRSEALSWAVKLVGEHTESWLSGLRQAMSEVDKLRSEGPDVKGSSEQQ